MAHLAPFRALRYSVAPDEFGRLVSPPYDVFGSSERGRLASLDVHNVVHIDYPVDSDGPERYRVAGRTFREWIESGVLHRDQTESLSIYRMRFLGSDGRPRETAGVVGALEISPDAETPLMPHEETTAKDHADRNNLLVATEANLSPIWGLSLASGLSDELHPSAEVMAQVTDQHGVVHTVERVSDADRIARICDIVSAQQIVIADGHHRLSVCREFSKSSGNHFPAAAQTMAYVCQLSSNDLTVAPIHRLISGVTREELRRHLEAHFDLVDIGDLGDDIESTMRDRGAMCLVDTEERASLLIQKAQFEDDRDLDSVRIRIALTSTAASIAYQHGVDEVRSALRAGSYSAAVLTRPVPLEEIRRTATTGRLMPPKSTFFVPKLLTGLLFRDLRE